MADFVELKHFLESDGDVPQGMWFKRFKHLTLVGEGEMPKSFLTPEMIPKGIEVF